MPEYLGVLLAFGIAAGTLATTVSQSALFKPLRVWFSARWAWGGELVSCPYCLGHWLALGLTPEFLHYSWTWLAVTWFAMTGVAAITSGVISRLHGD